MKKNNKNLSPESFFHEVGTHYVVAEILFSLNQTTILSRLFDAGTLDLEKVCKEERLNQQVVTSLLDYLSNVTPLFEYSREKSTVHLSEFGQKYLSRYSRRTADGSLHLNFWDVRVGGYGNVWNAVDRLSTNQLTYGVDIKREGQFAEGGVFKTANGFWPAIESTLKMLTDVDVIGEFGINSGLLKFVEQKIPQLKIMGIDKSNESIQNFKNIFGESKQIDLKYENILNVASWGHGLGRSGKKLFFSVHFHEFMAVDGLVPMLMRNLKNQFDEPYILSFEQPRYDSTERENMQEHLWLYSQSNILIHHLIGNGKILSRTEWARLFESTGGRILEQKPIGYLGYEMFLVKL